MSFSLAYDSLYNSCVEWGRNFIRFYCRKTLYGTVRYGIVQYSIAACKLLLPCPTHIKRPIPSYSSYLILSYLTWLFLISSYLILSYLILSYLILLSHFPSHLILSSYFLSHLILSYIILSHIISQYPPLFIPVYVYVCVRLMIMIGCNIL